VVLSCVVFGVWCGIMCGEVWSGVSGVVWSAVVLCVI
jgi:hypothetical protein